MANIPVAPFYVPRPAEDQLWSRGPISNRGIIDLCTTQLKWYGAPGQVPTKRWNSLYTDNDASVWNWPPQPSDTISLLTFQKFFGKGGQVPTKCWNISYTYDDPSVWNWPPQSNRGIIDLCTTQLKWFGAPGQVPTKRWNITYTFDDPAVWNSKPIASNTPYPAATIVRAPFYVPSFDHTIGWSLTIRRDMPLNTISVSPFINRQRSFNSDDPSLWQGSPILSKLLSPLLTAASQVKSQQWLFGYDDPAYWVGNPTNVASPIPMLTVGGIIEARQWHWDNDDPAMWSGWTNLNLINITTVFVAPNPFVLRQSQFTFDDPPVWNSKPIAGNTRYPVIVVRAPFYAPSFDHTIGWAKSPATKFSGLISVPSNPFIPVFYRFHIDDTAIWQQPQQRNIGLPVVPPNPLIPVFYRFHTDDAAIWQQPQQRNIGLPVVVPNPFVPVFYRFHADDAAIWQQPSQRSVALPFVPSIVDHWRMDIPDDQPWSLSIQYNLAGAAKPAPFTSRQYQFVVDDPSIWQQPVQRSIGLPFVPSIQNRWRLDTADDQLWSLTLRQNLILVTPIQPFVVRWHLDTADDLSWQPIKLRGIALQMVPAINNRRYPNTFDDLPWSPTKRLDLPMQVFTFVPPAFTSRQPSFAFDDQSSYQWPMKSSLILSLKWNINFERIANTISERRIVMASLERRTVTATPEIRIAGTKIETRIATTTPETRIAIAPDEDK